MSEDINQRLSKAELETWLKGRGVDENDAVAAADKLLAGPHIYDRPSALLDISVGELMSHAGIEDPVLARVLSNNLVKKPNTEFQEKLEFVYE